MAQVAGPLHRPLACFYVPSSPLVCSSGARSGDTLHVIEGITIVCPCDAAQESPAPPSLRLGDGMTGNMFVKQCSTFRECAPGQPNLPAKPCETATVSVDWNGEDHHRRWNRLALLQHVNLLWESKEPPLLLCCRQGYIVICICPASEHASFYLPHSRLLWVRVLCCWAAASWSQHRSGRWNDPR